MKKTLIKNWKKRVIIAILVATGLFMNAAAFTDNGGNVAYAADPVPAPVAAPVVAPAPGVDCATNPEDPDCKAKEEAEKELAGIGPELEDLKSGFKVLFVVQQVLNNFIWPVLVMIGGLLDNSILFGSGMEERLKSIWIPIRNIVNILFVIFLLGVALYSILGLGDENSTYSLKSMLPKLILGLIAVNFSFFIMKIALDGVNVITTAIFSLPDQVGEELSRVSDFNKAGKSKEQLASLKQSEKRICTLIGGGSVSDLVKTGDEAYLDSELAEFRRDIALKEYGTIINFKFDDTPGDISAKLKAVPPPIGPIDEKDFKKKVEQEKAGALCNGRELTPLGIQFLSRWSSQNAALALALNMGKIMFYQDVPMNLGNADQLVVNAFFSVLLYLVYTVSFLALFVVLLARLLVLWLAIAMSPILLLIMFVPQIKEKMGEIGGLADKVVKHAIAPILIALALTVGWIMLQAVRDVNSSTSVIFSHKEGIPVVGLQTLQDLIVALATVGVVWLGVFSAASETIAAGATNWMKERLMAGTKYLGTLPMKYIPFMPVQIPGVEGTKHITPHQLGRTIDELTQRAAAPNNFSDLVGLGKQPPPSSANAATDHKALIRYMEDKGFSQLGNNSKLVDELRKMDPGKKTKMIEEVKDRPRIKGILEKLLLRNGTLFPEEIRDLEQYAIDQGITSGVAAAETKGDKKKGKAAEPEVDEETKKFAGEIKKAPASPFKDQKKAEDAATEVIQAGKDMDLKTALTDTKASTDAKGYVDRTIATLGLGSSDGTTISYLPLPLVKMQLTDKQLSDLRNVFKGYGGIDGEKSIDTYWETHYMGKQDQPDPRAPKTTPPPPQGGTAGPVAPAQTPPPPTAPTPGP